MAIENLIQAEGGDAVIMHQTLFQQSTAIVAGTFKVKHPLMEDTPMLVIGFIIEDKYFNQEDFKIKGLEIKYRVDGTENYDSENNLIYPKIVIDLKKTHCSYFFKNEPISWRDKEGREEVYLFEGKYYWNENGVGSEAYYNVLYNYYLFSLVSSNIPESCADSIFAVCKYREEGSFRHAIFNLHEIIPLVD